MLKIICEIDVACLIKQVDKYVEQNPAASLDKHFHWTSNGNYDKKICETISLAIREAAWIDYQYVESKLKYLDLQNVTCENLRNVEIDFTIFLDTLKLAVKYVAHKKMRRAYAAMWSSDIPIVAEGHLPQMMIDAKNNMRHAFCLFLNFYPEMVCGV